MIGDFFVVIEFREYQFGEPQLTQYDEGGRTIFRVNFSPDHDQF